MATQEVVLSQDVAGVAFAGNRRRYDELAKSGYTAVVFLQHVVHPSPTALSPLEAVAFPQAGPT